jgi:PAS domain S-box-containing protein
VEIGSSGHPQDPAQPPPAAGPHGCPREAETALGAKDELLSKIFLACPDAISIADMADGTYVEINQVFLDLMGLRREQIIGRTSAELQVWVDPEERRQFVDLLAARGSIRNQVIRFRMGTGEVRSFEVSSEVIQVHGRPHSFNFMRDITDRERAERELQDSERQFRLLFDQAPIGMATVDSASGRFLSVNPRLCEILGRSPEELTAHTFQDYTHPDHRQPDEGSVRELARGAVREVRKENRYLHRSGKVVWARLTMVRMPSAPGAPARDLSLVEDITEGHQYQEELRSSADRLQKVADRVPGVVYQYRRRPDGSTQMPFASEAIRGIYGLTPEDARQDVSLLISRHHPEDHERIMASIEASARTLTPWKLEYRLQFPDGRVRFLFGDAVPEREADGSVLWTGFITDITERKLFEAQIQQAQKMDSLGSLAGGVAHDMNNVLAAILATASARLLSLPRADPGWQALETIREAATRGGEVVRSLLKFARQNPAERRFVDLNELLLEQARLLEHTTLARIRLELDLASELRPVHGDAGELANVIINLCVNAVDAMAGGGTLILRTCNLAGHGVEVRVEDTGCGMTEEVLAKAMDPFFTTKEVGKGTGLGLAMVYMTMKAHQGQVEIHSAPGRGTQVTLVFPGSVTRDLGPAPAAADPAGTQGQGLRILLVDDDELILRSTGMLLNALGHAATACASGEEALALVAAGYRPQLVILDMNMPGLGGKGSLPRLRSLVPGVPVFLATGRADQEVLDLVDAHPRVSLLAKPFSLEELQDRLGRI